MDITYFKWSSLFLYSHLKLIADSVLLGYISAMMFYMPTISLTQFSK
jgi:hypothetical protein